MKNMKVNVAVDELTISGHSSNWVSEYSNSIPIDLLIDIFSRVPAKSIARFRCVSKFWASILNRTDFKELFLTKSLSRPQILLSFKVNEELFVFSAPQPQNPDENSSIVVTRYKSFPKYFPTEIHSALCGSVFLHGRRGKAHRVICNPVTGESITLPSLKAKGINRSCFGFDPINKQFKVLCITWSDGKPNTNWILTLGTGKRSWRTIQDPIFPHYPFNGEVCINGVLYYKAYFERVSLMILCFDFRSEKFRVINRDKHMLHDSCWTLFNYKGKLGACRFSCGWREEKLVLWVLEDAGKHKWSNIICVPPPLWYKAVDCTCKIVGMTSTGEIVLSSFYLSNPFYLFYYNVERNTFTRLDIKGLEEFNHLRFTSSTINLDYVENMMFM